MNTQSPIKSNVFLIAHDKDGNEIDRREIHNTDVRGGRACIAALMGGITDNGHWQSAIVGEIATTNDNTAITDADLGFGLVTYITAETVNTLITTTTTNDTLRAQAVISYPAGQTIRKAGLFKLNANSQTEGMFCAALVSPDLVMPSGSSLTAVWTVQIT